MKCIDKKELKLYLQGKLDPEQLIAMDEHISGCLDCRNQIKNEYTNLIAVSRLASELLQLNDCPEYEILSSYVDGKLDADKGKIIKLHLNSCPECFNDIEHIERLRAQSLLRETIYVKAEDYKKSARKSIFWGWKLAAMGSTAALVIFGILSVINPTSQPTKPAMLANKPSLPIINNNKTSKPVVALNPKVTIHEVAPKLSVKTETLSAPRYAALLKDGPYRLIKNQNGLELSNNGTTGVKTPLEAKLAQSIDEKLRTGKIKMAQPVMVAMNTIRVRGDENYVAPPTAPKLVSPNGVLVVTQSPILSWNSPEMAEVYRVTLTDKDGNKLFDEITQKNRIMLHVQLKRGEVYSWRVGVKFGEDDTWTNSEAARFKVVSQESIDLINNVKKELAGSHLALGVTYESIGLNSEAENEYREVIKSNPNSQLAKKLKAEL